ncbi:metallophosphoesterase [Stackebrandtia soli]|uniref:metallophosphoesterase n=1 Tax=Stackebrandtia soli TaxID=1892856 RepID=UPI0039E9805D
MSKAAETPVYVVSDVHGHRDILVASLERAGLIDGDGRWSGGKTRLWFLGDLFDRGTDGVGVVELLMRLAGEAEDAGGMVDTLLGNHEILMLGARRFGDEEVDVGDGGPRNFRMWWHLNGGQDDDVARLSKSQVMWLQARQVIAYESDHLLVHTDTVEYGAYGRSINAVNRNVRKILRSDDFAKWWGLFRDLTIRHRFEAEDGPAQAAAMLDFFGGSQIVHGHSTIPDRLGIPGDEVVGPRRYCDRLCLCVDGGIYQGGPCLVVPLPVPDDMVQPDPVDDEDVVDGEPEDDERTDEDSAPDDTETVVADRALDHSGTAAGRRIGGQSRQFA